MKKGAYFDIQIKDGLIYKTLIHKKGGSKYPKYSFFIEKINTLIRHLEGFIVDTKIDENEQKISLTQKLVIGQDLFNYIKMGGVPNRLTDLVDGIEKLYSATGILPDLLNEENILVDKNNEIIIVDVWPLFFEDRLKEGDINQESYDENIKRFNYLKSLF